MIKKLTRRIISSGAAMTIALSAAVLPAAAESALEKIKSEGKIVVGISNAPIWGFRTENGDVAGFSPDLIRAALEPLGVKKVDFVISEFPALISSLQSSRFDAIAAGMWITPVRCKAVAFSDPDLVIKDAVLVKKGNPSNIHSYEDIAENSSLKIGADRGSAAIEHAISAGISRDQTVLYQEFEGAVAALLAGRIDAAPLSSANVGAYINDPNLSGIERTMPFTGYIGKDGREEAGWSAIAFRLGDADLRDAYNKRLTEMKADGTVAAIMKKYGVEAEIASDMTAEKVCGKE